jgi:competence protein ComEC
VSDLTVVVMAVAAWVGAAAALPVPRWPAGAVAVVALLARWPRVLVVAIALLAAGSAAAAVDGLDPAPTGRAGGWATLAGDPEPVPGGQRVEVRLGGRRYDAWARGRAAAALAGRAAGERVELAGRLRPLGPTGRRTLRHRHVAARLEVEVVGTWRPGSGAARVAGALRRTLQRGARPLDDDARSLLLGVVLGDDRGRPPELEQTFRAAGLSHLLAASGQNVAYLLALAGPLLRRLGLWPRLIATTCLLTWFGVLTGWDPSVVRASAMAAVAAAAATVGRPTGRLRLLALAVTGALLVDPLLVGSVGFRLSVGATVGIALLAGPVASRLRGPAWLRETVATTLAAQIGVLPVAVPVFGGVPLAAVPANVLAAPAVAPLTLWGLTAGVVAGRVGRPADAVVHAPTGALTAWLAGVARWAAGLGLPAVGGGPVLVVGCVVTAGMAVRRRRRRSA